MKNNKIILFIFTILFFIYPLLIIIFNNLLLSVFVSIIITIACFCFLKVNFNKINSKIIPYIPHIIFGITLISRLIIVFFFNNRIVQISDFNKALNRAYDLNFTGDIYYQVFSHWILYPRIINIIFKFFGSSQLIALIFNAICVSLSSVLIYLIGCKVFNNYKIGLIGCLIYIFWPSTVFYVIIFTPDHIAGLLLLFATNLYLIINNKNFSGKKYMNFFIPLIVGASLGLSIFFKNFGPVLLIAIVMTLFLEIIANFQKNEFIKKIGMILLILIGYIVIKSVTFIYIEGMVENKVGKNIAPIYLNIGLSSTSKGYYNSAVYDLYFQELKSNNFNFEKTNKNIMSTLLIDIKSNYKKIPNILYNKTITNFNDDSIKFEWVKKSLIKSETGKVTTVIDKILKPFTELYYIAIILSMIYMLIINNRERNLDIFLLYLFIFGSAILLVLVEAQGRYRYAIEPFMCILAGAGIYYYKNFIGGIINEKLYKINETKTLS